MPSTAIRDISHDGATNILFVTFVDGDTYAYFDAPADVFQAFCATGSKGGFFARQIRNRYRYRKLDGRPDEGGAPIPARPSAGPASPPPAAAGRSA